MAFSISRHGLCARRPRTIRMCSADAQHWSAIPSHLADLTADDGAARTISPFLLRAINGVKCLVTAPNEATSIRIIGVIRRAVGSRSGLACRAAVAYGRTAAAPPSSCRLTDSRPCATMRRFIDRLAHLRTSAWRAGKGADTCLDGPAIDCGMVRRLAGKWQYNTPMG